MYVERSYFHFVINTNVPQFFHNDPYWFFFVSFKIYTLKIFPFLQIMYIKSNVHFVNKYNVVVHWSFLSSSQKLILLKYSFLRKWCTPKKGNQAIFFHSVETSRSKRHAKLNFAMIRVANGSYSLPPIFSQGITADKSPAQENHSFANISYPRSPFLKFTTPRRIPVAHKFRAKPTRSVRLGSYRVDQSSLHLAFILSSAV